MLYCTNTCSYRSSEAASACLLSVRMLQCHTSMKIWQLHTKGPLGSPADPSRAVLCAGPAQCEHAASTNMVLPRSAALSQQACCQEVDKAAVVQSYLIHSCNEATALPVTLLAKTMIQYAHQHSTCTVKARKAVILLSRSGGWQSDTIYMCSHRGGVSHEATCRAA